MRIAVLGSRGINVSYSGIETALTELCPRLVSMGHEIDVFARQRFRIQVGGEFKGVRVRYVPSLPTKHLDTLSHVANSIPAVLFGDYDIVHFHALGPSIFSCLPRIRNKKAVVTVHGLDWQRAKWGFIARHCLRMAEFCSARFPHATILVSRTLCKHYESTHRGNFYYIPNGAPEAKPCLPNKIKQWGLNRPFVLFVSRLTPEKEAHTLIKAWQGLTATMPLVIVGDNPYNKPYVRKLHDLDSSRRILFLGRQEGDVLAELFSNAYLYVLPSRIEGLPISLIEAMSYGCCPVVSDIPANLEVVENLGYTFRCGDADDLTRALQIALNTPAQTEASAQKSPRLIRGKYNWDDVATHTSSLYYKLGGR